MCFPFKRSTSPICCRYIQDHSAVLCDQLDVKRILPYLKAEGMLTTEEYEALSFFNSSVAVPKKQMREELLIPIRRKGSNFFENFSKCLVWSGQTELARHIGVNVEDVPECPHACHRKCTNACSFIN